MVAYLLGYRLLPFERCAETLKDLFDCHLSVGTLATIFKECSGELNEPLLLIKEGLRKSEVIGVDETNLRVQQKQQWVHVSSTEQLTLLVHHKWRGRAAIENIGILPSYKGVCVHGGFTAYDQYLQCRHSLCNVHILRELNYVIVTSRPQWAQGMKALLVEIKSAVDKARGGGRKKLSPCLRAEFLRQYEESIEQAKKLYGTLKSKRGRAKKPQAAESPIRAAGRKLACRLDARRDEILLFMQDFSVPFDNNQSERDLRMLKVKQKVSGCFRTSIGAEEFCRLRSYVSTMKKQGRNVMEVIKSVFTGETIMPTRRC